MSAEAVKKYPEVLWSIVGADIEDHNYSPKNPGRIFTVLHAHTESTEHENT